jgi:hypothetical protein
MGGGDTYVILTLLVYSCLVGDCHGCQEVDMVTRSGILP